MATKRKPRRRPKGLGSVYQHGLRWWIAYDDERGKRARIPGGFDGKGAITKTEAEERLKDLLAARHSGIAVNATAQRKTVDKYLDDYVADLTARGKKSISSVRSNIKRVRETFGALRPVAVTPEAITAYRVAMENAELSNATVNRGLQALRAAFRLAWKAGTLARPPYVPIKKEDNARTGFFELNEHLAIKAQLPAVHADVAEFGYLTGWRLGEVLGLRWINVDEEAVKLDDTKNGEKRTFPLLNGDGTGNAVAELIARRRADRTYQTPEGARESDYVFHIGGRRVWRFDVTWRKARAAVDLPGRLFHDYRRTAVRDLVRSGVSQAVAMRWTGHKTPAVFTRYDITATEDLKLAVDKVTSYRVARAARAAMTAATVVSSELVVH
jgi:integrase